MLLYYMQIIQSHTRDIKASF